MFRVVQDAMKRFILLAVVALLLGAGVWGYLYAQSRNSSPKYRLAQVERGPLTAAVSATGNLNAVVIVQVGSQVSGMIKELLVDFNSVVKKGQIVARIDPQIFEAQVNQAKADLQTAKAAVLNQTATVEKAKADVENARAALAQGKAMTVKADAAQADAKRIFERNAELFKRNLIAQADRDTAEANYDQAVAQTESSRANERALAAAIDSSQAQLRVQEAALQSARAQVDQKTAALAQAQANLDYTTIRAPVDGVVVSRAVDVGQTVAASLQAPTLFTIAQDLTKMQVETSVDEADIGRIKVEDRATYTVDAFSGQTFTGIVTQIRKAAQIVQNVVTYTVIISVDNPGSRLLPGMTANVKLVYAEKPSVLKVPNAALRFRPAGADAGPVAQARPTTPSGQAPRGEGGGRTAGEMRERLITGLGLSVEQQKKLDPILADTRQQMATLRDLPEGERQARAGKVRENTRARIRAILTPEQQTKYDEIAAREPRGGATGGGTPGRVWIVDAAGQPKAVPLTLGLGDGSATEVLHGDVKEGQDVIIGTAGGAQQNRPGTSGTGGSTPRLRL
jgi:HlyD family secretion protein